MNPKAQNQYKIQQEQQAPLQLLSFAEKDVKSGRTLSSSALRTGLKNLARPATSNPSSPKTERFDT